MRSAGIVALVLIALIATLAPAAYADPPDETWLGGYWDDDDFDNVVVFLMSASALVTSALLYEAAPGNAVAVLQSPEPQVVPAPVADSTSPRAPPRTVSAS